MNKKQELEPLFDEIIDAVCEYSGIDRSKILSKSRYNGGHLWGTGSNGARHERIVDFRNYCIFFGRKLGLRFMQIAKILGGRHHSSCVNGYYSILGLMDVEERVKREVMELALFIKERKGILIPDGYEVRYMVA